MGGGGLAGVLELLALMQEEGEVIIRGEADL
jgi:hypothetical protein